MSRKRSIMPDVYKNRKRACLSSTSQGQSSNSDGNNWQNHQEYNSTSESPSDTKAALLLIKNLFPVDKFEGRLPPIMLQHQLYSIVHSRTAVDKEVAEMRNSGEIRLFKMGSDANEFCIAFTEDYKCHVLKFTSDLSISKSVIDKFLSTVISRCQDVSLNTHSMLGDFNFKDEEITQLVKAGVLTVRDVGSWWIAIPCAGLFMKSFIRGRKATLTIIRKSKYKEILQAELEMRKLPKVAKLGMTYHIHDIIGADLVERISTSSGQLMRLLE